MREGFEVAPVVDFTRPNIVIRPLIRGDFLKLWEIAEDNGGVV
jgi:hypothetical protein